MVFFGDLTQKEICFCTLDRVSKANHKQMKVCLRTVYHVVKMLSFPGKKPFCKAILRMVDKKQNGLFLEVTGNNEQEVQKKLQPYVAHSCTMVAGFPEGPILKKINQKININNWMEKSIRCY